MSFLGKILVIMSLASVMMYGTDFNQLKTSLKNMKDDYVETGKTVKKYVQNESVSNDEFVKEIEALDNDIDSMLDSFDLNNVKEEVTKKFVTLTDFIFYGGEIKGVKFNDLTSTGKEVVMDMYNSLDQKIKSKYPNYQEVISEKVDVVKEKAASAKEYAAEKVTQAIGEENVNNIKEKATEAKDKVVEKTKETYGTAKEKVSGWYQKVKDKVS